MTGQTISHYRIAAKLGEGGMGVVYRADDVNLHRSVALKFLAPHSLDDPGARERFLREARAAASLDHPNVCTVYEIGEHEGNAYLAMAFVEGQTVKQKIAERPCKLDDALNIAIQAAEGLRAAHDKGIVHRDIKSANLMVTPDGGVKVMDFGLAQLAGQSGLTKSSTTLGTAAYMSPEQAQHQPVDRRADLWSLGVVLYEMITGRLPFDAGHEAAMLYAIVHSTPEPMAARRLDVPASLDRVVAKALAKNPDQRYQHAADLLVDLRAVQKGMPVGAPPLASRRNLLIAAGSLGAVAVAAAIGLNRTRDRGISSLAVLPLENLGGDPAQDYFADGVTDALTTDLSRSGALRVISRQSAMRYKGTRKALREIARELNVDALVGGSVARESGRVRISAQLIDASTDQNLWADSYDRELSGVLALQREVAQAIAARVRGRLASEAKPLGSQVPVRKVNPETYEAYLKGVFWLNKGTPEAFDKAVAFFQEAVDKDPADPLAYAGLATGYTTAGHLADAPEHRVPRARAAAQRALQLDDTMADAHLALAVLAGYRDFQWDACQAGIRRALELNPNLGFAHFQQGWLDVLYGRLEDAIAAGKRARELDPLSIIYLWVLDFYRMAKRYDEAIAECRLVLDADPKLFIARCVLGSTYSDMGRHAEAIAEMQTVQKADPSFRPFLGGVYAQAGRIAEARAILTELEGQKLTGLSAWNRAVLYSLLGDKDQAIRMLYFEPHHDWLTGLGFMKEFVPLRGDPRFQALLKKVNVPLAGPF